MKIYLAILLVQLFVLITPFTYAQTIDKNLGVAPVQVEVKKLYTPYTQVQRDSIFDENGENGVLSDRYITTKYSKYGLMKENRINEGDQVFSQSRITHNYYGNETSSQNSLNGSLTKNEKYIYSDVNIHLRDSIDFNKNGSFTDATDRVRIFEHNENNFVIGELIRQIDNTKISEKQYTLNDLNFVARELYDANGDGTFEQLRIYYYDEDGRLTEIELDPNINVDNGLKRQTITYQQVGDTLVIMHCNDQNDDGICDSERIEKLVFAEGNSISYHGFWEDTDANGIIESIDIISDELVAYYNINNDTGDTLQVFRSFREDGRITYEETESYLEDPHTIDKVYYTYDANNRLFNTKLDEGNDGDFQSKTYYSYEFETASIIYQVQIPQEGDWFVSLCGSQFDTELLVGTTIGGSEMGSNDDFCNEQSGIQFSGLQAGTYYVTVKNKTVNDEGQFTLNISNGPLAVSEVLSPFKIYPNPSSDVVNVSIGKATNFKAKLYNSLGKVVGVYHANHGNLTVGKNNLSNGLYLLQLEDNGHVYTHKLIWE